jgi:uncharacterized protein
MTEMKRLIVPLVQCKMEADATGDRGTFSGYASVWESIDLGGDTIRKGAFSNSLNEWSKKGLLPQLLWYHDMESVIGDWLEVEEDDTGLRVKGKLWAFGDLKVDDAVKAYNVINGTSVKGLSIGYRVKQHTIQEQVDGSTIRILEEIELLEVSIAPFAMEPKASVTSVKSFVDDQGQIVSKRECEDLLRDVCKLSIKQAKAFISGGYSAISRDEKSDLDNVSASLDQILNTFKRK